MQTSDTWGESEYFCSFLLITENPTVCPNITDLPLSASRRLSKVHSPLSPPSSHSPTEMPFPHLEAHFPWPCDRIWAGRETGKEGGSQAA